jgi:hypothetical protein
MLPQHQTQMPNASQIRGVYLYNEKMKLSAISVPEYLHLHSGVMLICCSQKQNRPPHILMHQRDKKCNSNWMTEIMLQYKVESKVLY